MRVLLDNNVNHRFARLLPNHEVVHVQDIGWENLQNGKLLTAAEEAGFQVLITADKQMRSQQHIRNRVISVIVLNSWRITWQQISPLGDQVNKALENLPPEASFIVIDPPGLES